MYKSSLLGVSQSQSVCVVFGIFSIERYLDVFLDSFLKSSDLTRADFDALYFLRFRVPSSGVTLSDFSRSLKVSTGTASDRITRLQGYGFVRRKSNPDRMNGTIVSLTKKGITVVDSTLAAFAPFCDNLLGRALASDELDAYLKLNSKLLAFLEDNRHKSK